MKPLKVAIWHKDRTGVDERDRRVMGWWAYPVPEFEWDFFPAVAQMALADFRNYDLIFHEDTCKCSSYDRRGQHPPLVYLAIDSTLSERHYQARLNLARPADLTLVDHDDLARFRLPGKPAERLNYCVNDHIFKPLTKTLDIAYHCGSGESRGFPGGKERNEIRRYLDGYCAKAGLSYKSGVLGLEEYAASMGSARVVVNWPRTLTNRPHRVFDALACGAALLTGAFPTVEGDNLRAGVDYAWYPGVDDLGAALDRLFDGDQWQTIAEAGHDTVMRLHTWSVRAAQLRKILERRLGL